MLGQVPVYSLIGRKSLSAECFVKNNQIYSVLIFMKGTSCSVDVIKGHDDYGLLKMFTQDSCSKIFELDINKLVRAGQIKIKIKMYLLKYFLVVITR